MVAFRNMEMGWSGQGWMDPMPSMPAPPPPDETAAEPLPATVPGRRRSKPQKTARPPARAKKVSKKTRRKTVKKAAKKAVKKAAKKTAKKPAKKTAKRAKPATRRAGPAKKK